MNSTPKNFAEWLLAATSGLRRGVRQRLEMELSAHYQEAVDELTACGMSPENAAREALARLGDVQTARELYLEEYAVETPWDGDFLPRKLSDAEYGYLKGSKLVACTRAELIELCKGKGMSPGEVSLAWTPETDRVVPIEQIPFLFDAIKENRRKSARWEMINAALWGPMIASQFGGENSNLRHIALFFGMLTVIPAVSGFRALRAANSLTPEALAEETSRRPGFSLWSGLQKSHLTTALVLLCALVGLMQIVGSMYAGMENAALVKSAVVSGEWWRLLTCVFLHAGFMHLLFNALGLGIFGHLVEVVIGRLYLLFVFLVTALAGSVFSFALNPETSVGASGGVLGLAGFLFAVTRDSKTLPRDDLQRLVVYVACFSAATGIIAFDLFDSAAHLGGLLAGLAIGSAFRNPKKLPPEATLRAVAYVSAAILVAGAVLAIVLMLQPKPRKPVKRAAPASVPAQLTPTTTMPARGQNFDHYFPLRRPETPAYCIDIFQEGQVSLVNFSRAAGLNCLSPGLRSFNGVFFDVRGLLRVAAPDASLSVPRLAHSIEVLKPARRIHFLHAATKAAPDGTVLGNYVVRFRSQKQTGIPVIYGRHLREWHGHGDARRSVSEGQVAWSIFVCHESRLFHTVWENPFPQEVIESIGMFAFGSETNAYPFVLGLTLDPPDSIISAQAPRQ